MEHHEVTTKRDSVNLGAAGARFAVPALAVGVLCLAAAGLLGRAEWERLQRAYLTAFMYVLSIGLGALWFVTIQHLTNARWSVVVRRVAELLASNMPVVWGLSFGVVLPIFLGSSDLYVWVDHDKVHGDHLLHGKAAYLNVTFFAVRWVLYFLFWTFASQIFLRLSVRQDDEGGEAISKRLQKMSAPIMIVFALTLTFCAIDLIMSLDATWFSTMFGVYYFAGCVLAGYSTLALCLMTVQRQGCLVNSVTREHYHDLGKMMFAFTVFWAYIGFSQFMLIWYADIPEETHWYLTRFEGPWSGLSVALLVSHFIVPFFGLMSRHVKRNKKVLGFWAVWVLVVHYLDMYWLIYPVEQGAPRFGMTEVACWVGVLAVFLGGLAFRAGRFSLLPKGDPRLRDSLAFENI